MPRENLRLSDFDYRLPKELIAQYPCARREDSRLLVLERSQRKISHRNFTDILDYFSAGDCLVLNNTRVICARLFGSREKVHPKLGGGKQEILLLENLSKNVYRVLAKPSRKLALGAKIIFNNGKLSATVFADEGRSKVIKFSGNGFTRGIRQSIGQVPLPPYIKRKPQDLDKERYQTVYAEVEGAAAAPTAGLHFSKEILKALQDKGVNIIYLTLHVNYGTFAPVKSEDITRHKMHREYFVLPGRTKKIVNAARARKSKIFAVGTTSVRVLETCLSKNHARALLKAGKGWTDLFIYPPYRFKTVDCLLTNFHFPKSTLLMLVSAFAGRGLIFKAYREAIEKKYRFFSYGDAMLIV